MTLRRGWRRLLLACAAAAGRCSGSRPRHARPRPTRCGAGDTLFGMARKAKHDGVSRNQMILAIWRANQSAFPGGNINLLEVGTILTIPARETRGCDRARGG